MLRLGCCFFKRHIFFFNSWPPVAFTSQTGGKLMWKTDNFGATEWEISGFGYTDNRCQQILWQDENQILLLRCISPGTWEASSGRETTGSRTSAAGERQHVELEYSHILLCELRVYFNQTRGDCEKTNQDHAGGFIAFMLRLNKVCFTMI